MQVPAMWEAVVRSGNFWKVTEQTCTAQLGMHLADAPRWRILLFIAAAVAGMPSSGTDNCTYIVKPGDTMSRIAGHQGTNLTTLMTLNPNISDVDLIKPGDRIITCGELAGELQPTSSNLAVCKGPKACLLIVKCELVQSARTNCSYSMCPASAAPKDPAAPEVPSAFRCSCRCCVFRRSSCSACLS